MSLSDASEPLHDPLWVDRLQPTHPMREDAIEELRSYLVRGLNRALSHRYGGKISAEDVAQEALLKILRSLDTFQNRSRFTTWAMSIAIRIGISELRRKHYHDVSLETWNESGGLDFPISSEERGEHHDEMERLKTTLADVIRDSLTEKQRIVIQSQLLGLPVEEIAARLNMNRNALYKLSHDARLKLRKGLEDHGYDESDVLSLLETDR